MYNLIDKDEISFNNTNQHNFKAPEDFESDFG